MRKSEEIKKGLEVCTRDANKMLKECEECPYYIENNFLCGISNMQKDALAYIEQLEETIQLMKIQMHGGCGVCKHRGGFDVEGAIMSQRCYECLKKETRPNWEYEGLPILARKENK